MLGAAGRCFCNLVLAWGGEVVRCYGLLDCNISGVEGGNISPPSQASGGWQGAVLGAGLRELPSGNG
jgi:hypothetical protein